MKKNSLLSRIFPASRRYIQWRFDELENRINNLEKVIPDNYREHFPMYESGLSKTPDSQKLIVSLTSFPDRMNTLYPCLYSLLNQKQKPDMLILWLSKDQFPNEDADLPRDILYLKKFGLTVRYVSDDLKPHKKYFYAFQEYPNDIIITVDDDVLYTPDCISFLFAAHKMHPDCICGRRGRYVRYDESNDFLPYTEWDLCPFDQDCGPSDNIILTGCGGILYPPHLLDLSLLDVNLIKEYAYLTDDLWLKTMEIQNEIKSVKVKWPSDTISIPGSQSTNLFTQNMYSGGNDEIIDRLAERFPKWKEIT